MLESVLLYPKKILRSLNGRDKSSITLQDACCNMNKWNPRVSSIPQDQDREKKRTRTENLPTISSIIGNGRTLLQNTSSHHVHLVVQIVKS
jgi:hypothetical protein